jgi:hypothetical protein
MTKSRVFDHALWRPWTVDKRFIRNPDPCPKWREVLLHGEQRRDLDKETYFMSGDGMLMPSGRDQPPPDLRYFKQSQK